MRANPSISGFVWDLFLALLCFYFYFILFHCRDLEVIHKPEFRILQGKPMQRSTWFLKAELCRHIWGYNASALCSCTSRATFEGSPAHAGCF